VVLPGDGAGLLRGLKEKGMGIRAVVGSQSLLDEAEKLVPHRFGFEADESRLRINTWQELEKKLRGLL
ncbi:MAG: hypothetical protein PVG78_15575, partial [Desulfobacterales bacterium]|jgi:hypothetical protein